MTKIEKEKEPVVVVFKDTNGLPGTIAYDNGRGPIRVYERDHVDPRFYLGFHPRDVDPVPWKPTFSEMLLYLKDKKPLVEACQVPLSVAKTLWRGQEFSDEVVSYER